MQADSAPAVVAALAVSPAARQRYVGIDVLKAIAILTVIWIHSFTFFGQSLAGVIGRLAFLTRFAVPAFFFASGFLYFRPRPMPAAQFLRTRVARIVVPYLIASAAALLFRRTVLHEPVSFGDAALALLSGNAFGIYYFIPLLLGAAVLCHLLARFQWLAGPLFGALWYLGLECEWLVIWIGPHLGMSDFLWNMRNPLRWWGYVLAGWQMAAAIDAVDRLAPATRRRLGGLALGVAAGMFLYPILWLPPEIASMPPTVVTLQYLMMYAVILGIFLASYDLIESAAIRFLSEATYPIYLYHYFFITLVQRFVPLSGASQGVTAYIAGLLGSLMLISVGRRLLGGRARLLIG